MVKNVRWLYNKLGTVDISGIGNGTVSGALSTVQSGLNGKADSGHSHGVSDLPVSSSQVDSTSYVPSSAAVYSLKSDIDRINVEIDQLSNIANTRFEVALIGNFNSASDADVFLGRFTHDNLYKDGDTELKLGNYIGIKYQSGINSGTCYWQIVGFDLEHNQTAADGTVYDNGYGIYMIPYNYLTYVGRNGWNYNTDTTYGGYIASYEHTTTIPAIISGINNVLGDHVVTRNVLLSNSIENEKSNGYEWTTTKGTLMSVGQLTGTFTSHSNKYDDGEATYKIPMFNYTTYIPNQSYYYWLRGISTSARVYCVNYTGIWVDYTSGSAQSKPLICIR